MDRSIRRALALIAAAACASAFAQAPIEGQDARAPAPRAEPETQPAPKVAPAPAQRRADPARIQEVVLEEPAASAKSLAPQRPGVPLQIGIARPVDALADSAKMAQRLDWSELADGAKVAAVSIRSSGAAAIRGGLVFDSLPQDARLRFYAPSGGEVYEATGRDVVAAVARNVAGGDRSSDAYTYWSPVVEGDSMVIEIEVPAGVAVDDVRIAAPVVSHLVQSVASAVEAPKASSSCENDVMCYSGTWGGESNAVGRIVFTSGGSSFLCSGTLLADQDTSTSIPYFLTAHHCIGSQTSASSIQAYWFYRSSACNSGVLGAVRTLSGGASLLYATSNTDTSFIRFNNDPPAGTGYAGWIASGEGGGASVTGIHHPGGDMQKISFGSVSSFMNCYPAGADTFNCNSGSPSSSTFYGIKWGSGITEPGSSGSALFANSGHYVVGQLYGGGSTCGGGGTDFYGRFDVAYNAALYQWLGGTPVPGGGGGGGSPAPGPTPTPTILPTLNYSDMWWNPNESGWGISITQHADGQMFAAWYNYNSSGNPAWIVMPAGTWTSPTTITGDLYATTGTSWTGPWNPVSTTLVGKATFTFTASDRATLSYVVNGIPGAKQIQRQPFGAADTTPVTNYGDLWWNASESGWGLSIAQHYRTLFAVWYTYGTYGGPTWMVMSGGTWISGDTYSGTLYRTHAAPSLFYSTPFDASQVAATPVGTLTLRLTGPGTAVMTATADGVTVVKDIARQSF